MKRNIFILFLLFCTTITAQTVKEGVNQDPFETKAGEVPYEMKDRKDEFTPDLTFNDCTQWIIQSHNVEADLYRTKQERVLSEYSGKIVYKTLGDNAEFRLLLKKPLLMKEWDCVEFWNYGDHWCWESNASTAMQVYIIIYDADGGEHLLPAVQAGYGGLVHKYWFLSHSKLHEKINGPAKFAGYAFRNEKPDIGVTHTIYMGNTYFIKEKLEPFTYKELPKKLPFPLRAETIAPLCKSESGKNKLESKGNKYIFSYSDAGKMLTYEVDPSEPFNEIILNNSIVLNNGASIVFENNTPVNWKQISKKINGDTLKVRFKAEGTAISQDLDCSYYIHNKSLVWTIEEKSESGRVAEINLGTTHAGADAQLIPIPFLVYNYSRVRPNILYSDGLFFFTMFDWYYTNASEYFAGTNSIENGKASYNGGSRYIPILNGKRNPVKERLFFNVSDDVQEVLPTIDNPASPMRALQSDRFWCIAQGDNLEVLGKYVSALRSKGVEKVSIRYHEDFWRKDGGSFTFRLEPSPNLSVQSLQDYVRFVKSKDWRIGFYSNYTDISPVNKYWNRDWIKMGPKGEWEVSWSRTYSPKPHVAWEQQAYFAPRIQKMFGTNHSYCDVHTAISPMSRVDYDYRSPGAGMFRSVIQYYGMLLMNERRSYLGPVYSEGGNHFWYAGLLDGNYANGDLKNLPVFPDFQLLKINPLEMDASNTGQGYEYLSYALAYGHIGMLCPSIPESIKRYAMLQPLQDSYSMVKIKDISYSDGNSFYNTSEAIKRKLLDKARIRLVYESGLTVYVNFAETDWKLNAENVILPRFGFYAVSADGRIKSSSVVDSNTGTRIDKVYSPEIFYLDTQDKQINGDLGGKGAYILKKEKFSWEAIPVENTGRIEFDLMLLGMENYGIDIQAMDENGNSLGTINGEPVRGRVSITPQPGHYKYNIIPVINYNLNQ